MIHIGHSYFGCFWTFLWSASNPSTSTVLNMSLAWMECSFNHGGNATCWVFKDKEEQSSVVFGLVFDLDQFWHPVFHLLWGEMMLMFEKEGGEERKKDEEPVAWKQKIARGGDGEVWCGLKWQKNKRNRSVNENPKMHQNCTEALKLPWRWTWLMGEILMSITEWVLCASSRGRLEDA